MKIMKMSDIIIPHAYAETIPREEKISKCRDFWKKCHAQDRFIILNKNNVLVDGYIQYLVLAENGESNAEVLYVNKPSRSGKRQSYRNSPTKYVYGKHINKKGKTISGEYVWRIPPSWKISDDALSEGTLAFAATKFGVSPIVITKCETLSVCPTEAPVKKIVKIQNQRCK